MKFIFSFILLLVGQAYALPLPYEKEMLELPTSFTTNYNFEGIVKLSNCSGSLFKFENASDTDFGLILTNGHCLGGSFLQPDQFVFRKTASRSFGLLNPAGTSVIGTVYANRIEYGTMTLTDLSVYRLTETYAQIFQKYNIRPLVMASERAAEGTAMDVISGYWQRGYSCYVERFVNLLKEDSWTWKESLRYSRPGCETIGGTSGSPIVVSGGRTIIGVNNTGNEDGQKCTMNNPCEVDENGNIIFEQGVSYGQQTYWLYYCLNEKSEIDVTIQGCLLPH